MLEIRKLTAAYHREYPILQDLELLIRDGESVGIMGRNGAGKSTLAGAIMNLVPLTKGEIIWDGQDIASRSVWTKRQSGIGYFIQEGRIFSSLTVMENLEISIPGAKKKDALEWAIRLSNYVPYFKSSGFLSSRAGNLSGGEKNLLSLSMVMASSPRLLILDEPFAGISPQNSWLMSGLIHFYLSTEHACMLLIDQNRDILKQLCSKVYVLKQKKLFPPSA